MQGTPLAWTFSGGFWAALPLFWPEPWDWDVSNWKWRADPFTEIQIRAWGLFQSSQPLGAMELTDPILESQVKGFTQGPVASGKLQV